MAKIKQLSQNERLLKYLKTHKGITTWEAFEKLHITNLAGRLYDLRIRGNVINSEHIVKKHKDGTVVQFNLYSLEKKK